MSYIDAYLRLTDIVKEKATVPDLQYGYIPPSLSQSETASYLLLVASVNQGGKAEAVGRCIRELWNQLGPNLFKISTLDPARCRSLVDGAKKSSALSRTHQFDDTGVLRSASSYLATVVDLPTHARRFKAPANMVDHMAERISYFGRDPAGARKKAWMYMRWMVRPAPDLHIFDNFAARDLEMPLDVNTCRALAKFRRLLPFDASLAALECAADIPIANARNRLFATAFARQLFPDDPVIMDYPLFLVGRTKNVSALLDV